MKQYKISEIFASFQGEGNRTGWMSLWVRFFGCNLTCSKFGQSTGEFVNPYDNLLPIQSYDEFKVPETGCDSSYSWNPVYKNLAKSYTAQEIANILWKLGDEYFSMACYWRSQFSKNPVQLCFTGGEPMLQQNAMREIINITGARYITIETNGTKPVSVDFERFLILENPYLNWAISPKLESISGEKNAVKWDVINEYASFGRSGCLKFVVDDTEDCFDELFSYREEIQEFFLDNPHWVLYAMPVGATLEQQNRPEIRNLVKKFMKLGFNISLRNHIYVFGNEVGS